MPPPRRRFAAAFAAAFVLLRMPPRRFIYVSPPCRWFRSASAPLFLRRAAGFASARAAAMLRHVLSRRALPPESFVTFAASRYFTPLSISRRVFAADAADFTFSPDFLRIAKATFHAGFHYIADFIFFFAAASIFSL